MKLCALAALLLMSLDPSGAAEGNSDSSLTESTGQVPSWSVDLHNLGFARDQIGGGWSFLGIGSRNSYLSSRFVDHALVLTPKGEVAVVFTTITMNSRRYVPGTGMAHLISIDGETGKVIAAKQWPWPDHSDTPSLAATPKGNFLLLDAPAARHLTLYSPALQVINEVQLGKPATGDDLHFEVSTDGNYVFIHTDDDNRHTVSIFDTETLHPIRSLSYSLPVNAVSNSGTYFARWQHISFSSPRRLYVSSKETEWKEIYTDAGCNDVLFDAGFLTENLLAVRSCNKLTLVDTEGNVYFSKSIPPKYQLGKFGASADGHRFATSVARLEKQPFWLGDPGYDRVQPTLTVYDTASHQSVSIFMLNQKDERPYTFAFSRDASQIVLLRSGIVELYRITGKQ